MTHVFYLRNIIQMLLKSGYKSNLNWDHFVFKIFKLIEKEENGLFNDTLNTFY